MQENERGCRSPSICIHKKNIFAKLKWSLDLSYGPSAFVSRVKALKMGHFLEGKGTECGRKVLKGGGNQAKRKTVLRNKKDERLITGKRKGKKEETVLNQKNRDRKVGEAGRVGPNPERCKTTVRDGRGQNRDPSGPPSRREVRHGQAAGIVQKDNVLLRR